MTILEFRNLLEQAYLVGWQNRGIKGDGTGNLLNIAIEEKDGIALERYLASTILANFGKLEI